ncbi:MAG: shikimate dehydrogenase [Smithella sp.]
MICIPITARSNKEALHDTKQSCLIAGAIEIRMDLIADGSLPELIAAARHSSRNVEIIVTCRKKEEAAQVTETGRIEGETENQKNKKMAILKQAVDLGADFIDIELSEGADAIEELKSYCKKGDGATKLIISCHDFKRTPALVRLRELFHQCRKYEPGIVKIVTFAKKPEDNLRMLSLIPYARKHKQEIIALCMGEVGRISRVMAPYLGNYLTFAALGSQMQSAPGQLTAVEMKQINKLLKGDEQQQMPALSMGQDRQLKNYILLGNPVGHSLSPLMHNAALNALGQEGRYDAFCVYDLAAAIQGLRGMDIRGASVTIPFKTDVMEYLDNISEDALKIGAVNTIINNNGRLTGANTDWLGIIVTLREAMTVKGKKFAIIGAGGTARAAAYGIIKEGGFPVIVNRTAEKGERLALEFNCPFYSLGEIDKIEADCLINTTPVGMYPHIDQSPVDSSLLTGFKYVMDVIYNPLETRLLKEAGLRGCRILTGLDMFVHQGAEQIKLWTGKEPDRALMKKVVKERLTQGE